nr:MAG TPA: hypothetical protein [Bacteriophage sp.]
MLHINICIFLYMRANIFTRSPIYINIARVINSI